MTTPPTEAPAVTPLSRRLWVGWAIALTASLTFSFATPIARAVISGGVNSIVLLVVRMLVATALMGITLALFDRQRLRADARCFRLSWLAGTINALGMLAYFRGLERLESSMAAMLIAISPLAVLTLLALRGERVTYRHAVRLVLALFGVYLLIGPGGDVDLIGVAWISGALLCFALQLSLLQWYLLAYDARTVTFYVLSAMSVGVLILWGLEGAPWQALSPWEWGAAIFLAVMSTYLSRLLLFAAVSRIGGGQMAMLSPVETLLSVIWSLLFLGERLSLIQWMGGVLILVSAVLAIQRLSIARFRPRWRLWAKS